MEDAKQKSDEHEELDLPPPGPVYLTSDSGLGPTGVFAEIPERSWKDDLKVLFGRTPSWESKRLR